MTHRQPETQRDVTVVTHRVVGHRNVTVLMLQGFRITGICSGNINFTKGMVPDDGASGFFDEVVRDVN